MLYVLVVIRHLNTRFEYPPKKDVCLLINSVVPAKLWTSHLFSTKKMLDGAPYHVHWMWQHRQEVLHPPNLPHISTTSGITKLSHELIEQLLYTWLILRIHENTGANLSSRGCVVMCVWACWCACVCMTVNILDDDGLIIRLIKRLILFHIKSCYPLRWCCPQLRVCLFYLLINTVFVSYIDNA